VAITQVNDFRVGLDSIDRDRERAQGDMVWRLDAQACGGAGAAEGVDARIGEQLRRVAQIRCGALEHVAEMAGGTALNPRLLPFNLINCNLYDLNRLYAIRTSVDGALR